MIVLVFAGDSSGEVSPCARPLLADRLTQIPQRDRRDNPRRDEGVRVIRSSLRRPALVCAAAAKAEGTRSESPLLPDRPSRTSLPREWRRSTRSQTAKVCLQKPRKVSFGVIFGSDF